MTPSLLLLMDVQELVLYLHNSEFNHNHYSICFCKFYVIKDYKERQSRRVVKSELTHDTFTGLHNGIIKIFRLWLANNGMRCSVEAD